MSRYGSAVRNARSIDITRRTTLYRKAMAKDAKANGTFFVGVRTTGIYCLPSCRAKKPLLRNVIFFLTEDEAQAAGLRACRVCRPDLFMRGTDVHELELRRVLELMDDEDDSMANARDLASRANMGQTKLNALFQETMHDTPATFLRRRRVERAQRELLKKPTRDVLAIAFDCGFASASAFYRQFLSITCMTPKAYRQLTSNRAFHLHLPASYDARSALAHVSRDVTGLSERRTPSGFFKALVDGQTRYALEVRFTAARAQCIVHTAGAASPSVMTHAHRVALRLLGLATGVMGDFAGRASHEPLVQTLVARTPGCRLIQTASVFEALVWALLGQQVTVEAATRLRRKLTELVNRRAPCELLAPPQPADIAQLTVEQLTGLGLVRMRAQTLREVSSAIAGGKLELESHPPRPASATQRALTAFRGVGPWTAQYTLLRGAGFGDVTLANDAALSKSLEGFYRLAHRPTPPEVESLMAPFAPHRSAATILLWHTLRQPESR